MSATSSVDERIEAMKLKRRDLEDWMSHCKLPEDLKKRFRRYERYKWQLTRGIEEVTLIRDLPKDLKRDLKRHLFRALRQRVPMFERMNKRLFDAMCDHLKPVLYTEGSFIISDGDPVEETVFIMRGELCNMTIKVGRASFFDSYPLKAGDICGEEIFTWALDPRSNLPTSTRTLRALTEVEAFALEASDLKFVASRFRNLYSKQVLHTFKFYSQQWRTRAACPIQAAWRQHWKRKLEKSLREEEDRWKFALAKEAGTSSLSLGATI